MTGPFEDDFFDEDPDLASHPEVIRARINYGNEAKKEADRSEELPDRYAPDDPRILARFGINDDDWTTVGW